MRRLAIVVLSGIAAVATLATPAAAAESVPFPLLAVEGSVRGELAAIAPVMEHLRSLDRVRLTDVVLPDIGRVDLDLRRVSIASLGAVVRVDGRATGRALDEGVTLWTGTVHGDASSEVYLALSSHGSRGWVRTRRGMAHLLAAPGESAGWSAPLSRWTTDAALRRDGVESSFTCGSDDVTQPHGPSRVVLGPEDLRERPLFEKAGAAPPTPLYDAPVAVETDWQYFQVFGNLNAAQAYAASLMGAVSARYREQNGTILTYPYLNFYTNPGDPWTEQDIGGNCIDVLYEFQNAWKNGQAPAEAELYHMLSGANLGCGVAWLAVLCDDEFGFSVSGNIDGQTPFPIAQGPMNWDFMVMAHELGHNFSSPHTHDFCPPLDQCAPSGYFGQCQNQQVCTSSGTIMSYCHLCSGGLSNITTYFHTAVEATIRPYVEQSCLQPFEGVFTTDLGFALPGSNGTPNLQVGYTKGAGTLDLDVSSAPATQIGVMVLSATAISMPFLGGTLVPNPDLVLNVTTDGAGEVSLSGTITVSLPNGFFFYAQAWFLDPTGPNGFAATNAVQFELITP